MVTGTGNYKAILSQAFDKQVNPNKIKSELKNIADWGAAYIYSAAPYRTGRLAGETDCRYIAPYSILLESPTEYAGYQNSGTSRIRPTYYFDRSAKAIEDRIHAMLKTAR